jgi:hypothetical protein
MADEFTLSPEVIAQLRQLWLRDQAELRNPDAGHRRQNPINESETLQGFLVAALDAATDEKTGEATASLDVWYRDPVSGDLADGGRTVTVTNRDTGFSAAAGDYLRVQWLEGEWRPFRPATASGAGLVMAILDESLCESDRCAAVRCVVGTTENVGEPCNPLHRQGEAGDVVVLAKVSLLGSGYDADCADASSGPSGCTDAESAKVCLPCRDESLDEEDRCTRPSEASQWIVLTVERKYICVAHKVEKRENCLVYGKVLVPYEVCPQSDEVCGEIITELEPVSSPTGCDDVDATFDPPAQTSECTGIGCAESCADIEGRSLHVTIQNKTGDCSCVDDAYLLEWELVTAGIWDMFIECAGGASDNCNFTFECDTGQPAGSQMTLSTSGSCGSLTKVSEQFDPLEVIYDFTAGGVACDNGTGSFRLVITE